MTITTNRIYQGDCVQLLSEVTPQSVNLCFADPPFNIGYDYDVYDDDRGAQDYLDWCESWMRGIHTALKSNGTFWLAIGDEFAAELKLLAQNQLGFHCRSWVIWYYTFGVNCKRGFSRSHTHLFHFVKDPDDFTFNENNPAVRVPSARQLVYADNRANSAGRLPDNTWILRPQDVPPSGFAADHDTWYFPRVAGTFKEREGFHGCQMPEQLLGRIIRASSLPLDVVLDPFGGSGTTLAVAKKLRRQFIGFELSEEYAEHLNKRLNQSRSGDSLDGAEDPVRSAPKTSRGKKKVQFRNGRPVPKLDDDTEAGIIAAFEATADGHSTDVMLCDPDLNEQFIEACKEGGVDGDANTINRLLLRIRKQGSLPKQKQNAPSRLSDQSLDSITAACEVALELLTVDYGLTLDELLCSPQAAQSFQRLAESFSGGASAFDYRWGALQIRKRAKRSKSLADQHFATWLKCELPKSEQLKDLQKSTAGQAGVYVLYDEESPLYVGASFDIGQQLKQIIESDGWNTLQPTHGFALELENNTQRFGLQSALIQRLDPPLNSELLKAEITSEDSAVKV